MAQVPINLAGTIDIVTRCTICGKDLMAAIMVDTQNGRVTISIDPTHDCQPRTFKRKQRINNPK